MRFLRRLWAVVRRQRRERQMQAEFAYHLDREAAAHLAAGMSPTEARRAAALALGGAEHWQEEAREAAGIPWLENLGRDLRLALRGLRRAPGFAAVAILPLALGIGANTAIFSAVDAVLLRPLPFPQPQRLEYIWNTDSRRPLSQMTVSYPNFLDLRRAPAFSGLAAYVVNDLPLTGAGPSAALPRAPLTRRPGRGPRPPQPGLRVALTGAGTALHVRAAEASANLFDVLGVHPSAGRGFLPGEDAAGGLGGLDAVVLSDHLARQKFGTPAAALGRRLVLDQLPYQVVGVMPAGFQFPLDDHEDLWVTIAPLTRSSQGPPLTEQRDAQWMYAVGRLAPGASPLAATRQMNGIAAAIVHQYPKLDPYLGVRLQPMRDTYTGDSRPTLLLLLGAVGCVLLIACVNVAGLLLARAARRGPEFALRAALGASRGAMLRQLGCESLLWGLAGTAAGVAVGEAAIAALVKFGPDDIVRLRQASLSPAVLLFSLAAGLVTAVLFGLFPAWDLARHAHHLSRAMSGRNDGGGRGGDGARPRWLGRLVKAEFALALVVLAATMLLVHSLARLAAVDPGFSSTGVLSATINLPDARYPSPDADAAFFTRLIAELRRQPGIEDATAAMPLPFSGDNLGANFFLPDHPQRPWPSSYFSIITPEYFHVLSIPLLAGRDFSAGDVHAAPQVAIVNQAFARQFLAGRAVLGARIDSEISSYPGAPQTRVIVGVVGDTRMRSLSDADRAMIYMPQAQIPFDGLMVAVRAGPGGEALAAAGMRRVVAGMDPDIPIFDLGPLSSRVRASLGPAGFEAGLLALFAGLALLLAAVGLYAVMAQLVVQRRREIGIRMALGAERGQVVGMILRQGMAMAGIGIAAGLAAAWALSRVLADTLSAKLYAVSPFDPVTLAGAPLLLLVVAGLACALPARRAAGADPVQALRLE